MSRTLRTAERLPPARDGEAEISERVTVLDLATSAVHDYRLVEQQGEPVAEGEVSVSTPLGSALVGCHVGDVVSVAHGGQIIRLEVVELDG